MQLAFYSFHLTAWQLQGWPTGSTSVHSTLWSLLPKIQSSTCTKGSLMVCGLMQHGEGSSPLLMAARCCVPHLFGWRQAPFLLIIVSSYNLFQEALMLTTLHASIICKTRRFICFIHGGFCYNLFPPGELAMYSML